VESVASGPAAGGSIASIADGRETTLEDVAPDRVIEVGP
jgi:hypothetical protein